MPQPVIGYMPEKSLVNGRYQILPFFQDRDQLYLDFLERAGARLMELNYHDRAEEVLPHLDGWLLPGGSDLNPAFYGEKPHPLSNFQEHSTLRFF